MDIPTRAHELTIRIGADNEKEAINLLESFVDHIKTGSKSLVSGGVSSGGWISWKVDESISPEIYQANLERYHEKERAKEVQIDPSFKPSSSSEFQPKSDSVSGADKRREA